VHLKNDRLHYDFFILVVVAGTVAIRLIVRLIVLAAVQGRAEG